MTPTTCTTTTCSTTSVARTETVSNSYLGKCSYTACDNQTQIPLGGLLTELIQRIFMQCLSNEDIKGFTALSFTNVHSYMTMQKLVNETALTKLCSNLRILDAKTLKFQEDLEDVGRCKALWNYYKLEPFVEGREGLTMIFNLEGLTLQNMKENKCGITVKVLWDQISEELDNVPEEDTGPEMISNAPITETRWKSIEAQETRVRDEVRFDGKPTLIQYLALLIATQKELKICLYGEKPLTYGSTSIDVGGCPLVVGGSALGRLSVRDSYIWNREGHGAGGRLKLKAIGEKT